MASVAYTDDVFALVQALAETDITRTVMELVPDADASTEIHIAAYLDRATLRPAIAVQQSLQLCVDTAAVVVDASSRDVANLDRNYVESVLRDRLIELTIVDLRTGSFLARFSINPRTEGGRGRLLAIAGVAVVALTLTAVLPPAAIVVAGGLPSLATILTPDAIPQTEVPLRTIDPADIPSATEVRVSVSNPAVTEQRSVHVYDIDLDGSPEANEAFLAQVRTLASVEAQSRFIEGASSKYQRVRVWSSVALDPNELGRLATASATEIVSIS